MKKQIVIPAILALTLVHCKSNRLSGYGYNNAYYSTPYFSNTSSYYNSAGTIKTPTYYPNYNYNPYSYYSTPYYSPYNYTNYYNTYPNYSPYYYKPYTWGNFGSHCNADVSLREGEESKMNFELESANGTEERNIIGKNLRAETFGERTEVEYRNENEKINFLTDQTGKTFVSGKILANDHLVAIDSKTQKCNATRAKFEEDPEYEIATFDCTDGNMKITAEVLIPSDQQHPANIRKIAQ